MDTITDEILVEGLKQRAQMIEDELVNSKDTNARRVLLHKAIAIFNVAKMFGAKDEDWTIRHSFIYNATIDSFDKLK